MNALRRRQYQAKHSTLYSRTDYEQPSAIPHAQTLRASAEFSVALVILRSSLKAPLTPIHKYPQQIARPQSFYRPLSLTKRRNHPQSQIMPPDHIITPTNSRIPFSISSFVCWIFAALSGTMEEDGWGGGRLRVE